MDAISFNIPYTSPEAAENIKCLIENPEALNTGQFLSKCKAWCEEQWPGYTAFMTTSCTRALELIALGMKLQPGDEIILSPFNYVGVGNAFAVYGAKLVYVDLDPVTMNINPGLIEAAVTDKTRAVVAMHYAGIPCDMDKIRQICEVHRLICIEDNAQGIGVEYQGRLLGGLGDFSVMSFDSLKNISCNEGGLLLCRQELEQEIDVAFSNGSNRTAFLKGAVKKYEWVEKGSKFTMNEYTAAVLYPLLRDSKQIIAGRKVIWRSLYDKIMAFEELRSYVPERLLTSDHNGHIAYLKFRDTDQRDRVMRYMNSQGVPCAFHYVPLDHSAAGQRFGHAPVPCQHSSRETGRLLRLPMHNFLSAGDLDRIVEVLDAAVKQPEFA